MVACSYEHHIECVKALVPARRQLPSWYVRGNGRIRVHRIGPMGGFVPGTYVPCAPVRKHPVALAFEEFFGEECAGINQHLLRWSDACAEDHCTEDDCIPLLQPWH
jgi:hypothetical protein